MKPGIFKRVVVFVLSFLMIIPAISANVYADTVHHGSGCCDIHNDSLLFASAANIVSRVEVVPGHVYAAPGQSVPLSAVVFDQDGQVTETFGEVIWSVWNRSSEETRIYPSGLLVISENENFGRVLEVVAASVHNESIFHIGHVYISQEAVEFGTPFVEFDGLTEEQALQLVDEAISLWQADEAYMGDDFFIQDMTIFEETEERPLVVVEVSTVRHLRYEMDRARALGVGEGTDRADLVGTGTHRVIILQNDISLAGQTHQRLLIPATAHVTLLSDGDTMRSLISTQEHGDGGAVIQVGAGARLILGSDDNVGVRLTRTSESGTGLWVNGHAIMYSGEISGQRSNGVWVNSSGVFEQHGGSIRDNRGANGAGVYITTDARFYMFGGSIEYNSAIGRGDGFGRGGGIFVNFRGTAQLHGNEETRPLIANNSAEGLEGGGGVFIVMGSESLLEVRGADFHNNFATQGGAIGASRGGTPLFTNIRIYSAKFTDNTVINNGGAIFVPSPMLYHSVNRLWFAPEYNEYRGLIVFSDNTSLLGGQPRPRISENWPILPDITWSHGHENGWNNHDISNHLALFTITQDRENLGSLSHHNHNYTPSVFSVRNDDAEGMGTDSPNWTDIHLEGENAHLFSLSAYALGSIAEGQIGTFQAGLSQYALDNFDSLDLGTYEAWVHATVSIWLEEAETLETIPLPPRRVFFTVAQTTETITVSPNPAYVEVGTTEQFSATVSALGNPPQNVVWSVSGNHSPNTFIDSSGVLFVDFGEAAEFLTVTATSPFPDDTANRVTTPGSATVWLSRGEVVIRPNLLFVEVGTYGGLSLDLSGFVIPDPVYDWSVRDGYGDIIEIAGSSLSDSVTISGLKPGNAVVDVAISCNESDFDINVSARVIVYTPVTNVWLEPEESFIDEPLRISAGDMFELNFFMEEECDFSDVFNRVVEWVSSDARLRVENKPGDIDNPRIGVVRSINAIEGEVFTATISTRALYGDPGAPASERKVSDWASIEVTVIPNPLAPVLTLNPNSFRLVPGQSASVTATYDLVAPALALSADFDDSPPYMTWEWRWESLNTGVITVIDSDTPTTIITAVAPGEAQVKVRAEYSQPGLTERIVLEGIADVTVVVPFITVTGITSVPQSIQAYPGTSQEINVTVHGDRRPQDHTAIEWSIQGNVCCTRIESITNSRAILTLCATQPLGNLTVTATVLDISAHETVDIQYPYHNIAVNVIEPMGVPVRQLEDLSYAHRIIGQSPANQLQARASLSLEQTFTLDSRNFFPDRIDGCMFLSQHGIPWHEEGDLVSFEIISHCDHDHVEGSSCIFARVEHQTDGLWSALSPGVAVSPLSNFRVMGHDTGGVTLRVTHQRSRQNVDINFNVTSLSGQLFFMQVSPNNLSNVQISYRTYCDVCNGNDGDNCSLCFRNLPVTLIQNNFVIFEPNGILTDIRITADRGGYFYSGSVNPGALFSGEISSLPMYPLNPIQLVRFGTQQFNIFYGANVMHDGVLRRRNTPFVGTVTVSGGFRIGDDDVTVADNVSIPVRPGGLIQLHVDPGTLTGIGHRSDIEVVYEISFGDGFAPQIVRLPLFSDLNSFELHNPRLHAMPWNGRNFVISEHRYINDDGAHDVSENENVGPSNDFPNGKLINSVVAMADPDSDEPRVSGLQFANVCGNYNPYGMEDRQRTRTLNYRFLSGRYEFHYVEFDLDEPVDDDFIQSPHTTSLFLEGNRVQQYVIRGQIDERQHTARLPYNIVNGVGLYVNLNDLPLDIDLSSMFTEGEDFEFPMRGYHPRHGSPLSEAIGIMPLSGSGVFLDGLTNRMMPANLSAVGFEFKGERFEIKIEQDASNPFKWKIKGYIKIWSTENKPKVHWATGSTRAERRHANRNCHALRNSENADGVRIVSGSETAAKKANPSWSRCRLAGCVAAWKKYDAAFDKNHKKAKNETNSKSLLEIPNTGSIRPFYTYADFKVTLSAFFEATAEWKPDGGAWPEVKLDHLGAIVQFEVQAGLGFRKLIPTKVGIVTVELSVNANLGAEVSASFRLSNMINNPDPHVWFSLRANANGFVRLRGSVGMEWGLAAVNVGVFGELPGRAQTGWDFVRNRPAEPPLINNTVCPFCSWDIDKSVEPYVLCGLCGHYHHAICWERNVGCAVNPFLDGGRGFRCHRVFEGIAEAGWGAGIDAVWRLGPPDIRIRIFGRTIRIRLSISGRQLILGGLGSGAWVESRLLGRYNTWQWPVRLDPEGRYPTPADDNFPNPTPIPQPRPDPDDDYDEPNTAYNLPPGRGTDWITRYAESSREHMLLGDVTIRSDFDESFAVAVWPSIDLSGIFSIEQWNCLQRQNNCGTCTDTNPCPAHTSCVCGTGDGEKLRMFGGLSLADLAGSMELSAKIFRNNAWEADTHRITTPSEFEMNSRPVIAICTEGRQRAVVVWHQVGLMEGVPIPAFDEGVEVIWCVGIIERDGELLNCTREFERLDGIGPTICPDCETVIEHYIIPLEILGTDIVYSAFNGTSWLNQNTMVFGESVSGDISNVSAAINDTSAAISFSVTRIEELANGELVFGSHYIYARQAQNAFTDATIRPPQRVATETSAAEYSRPMIEAYRQGFVVSYHTNNLNGRQDVILRKMNANGTIEPGALGTVSALAMENGLRPLTSNYRLVPNFGDNNSIAIAWVNFNHRANSDEIIATRLSADGSSDVLSVPILLENVCGRSGVGRESALMDGIMGSGSSIRVLHRSVHNIFRTGQNRTAVGMFANRFQYFAEVNTDMIAENSRIPVEFYIRNAGLAPIVGVNLTGWPQDVAIEWAGNEPLPIHPGGSGRFTAFVSGEPLDNFNYTLTAAFAYGAPAPPVTGTVWFILPDISVLPVTRNSINSRYANGWEFALGLTNEGTAMLVDNNYDVRLDFFLTPTFQEDTLISSITISNVEALSMMDGSMYSRLISRANFDAGRIHAHDDVKSHQMPNDELLLFVEATVVDRNGAQVPEKDYFFNRITVSFELTEDDRQPPHHISWDSWGSEVFGITARAGIAGVGGVTIDPVEPGADSAARFGETVLVSVYFSGDFNAAEDDYFRISITSNMDDLEFDPPYARIHSSNIHEPGFFVFSFEMPDHDVDLSLNFRVDGPPSVSISRTELPAGYLDLGFMTIPLFFSRNIYVEGALPGHLLVIEFRTTEDVIPLVVPAEREMEIFYPDSITEITVHLVDEVPHSISGRQNSPEAMTPISDGVDRTSAMLQTEQSSIQENVAAMFSEIDSMIISTGRSVSISRTELPAGYLDLGFMTIPLFFSRNIYVEGALPGHLLVIEFRTTEDVIPLVVPAEREMEIFYPDSITEITVHLVDEVPHSISGRQNSPEAMTPISDGVDR